MTEFLEGVTQTSDSTRLDNLNQTHDHPRFLALRKLHLEVAFTPTEASWLNLIEPHFGVMKRFTVVGTEDRSRLERRRRIYRSSGGAIAVTARPATRSTGCAPFVL